MRWPSRQFAIYKHKKGSTDTRKTDILPNKTFNMENGRKAITKTCFYIHKLLKSEQPFAAFLVPVSY